MCGNLEAIIEFHKRGPTHAIVRVRYNFLVKISSKCRVVLDVL